MEPVAFTVVPTEEGYVALQLDEGRSRRDLAGAAVWVGGLALTALLVPWVPRGWVAGLVMLFGATAACIAPFVVASTTRASAKAREAWRSDPGLAGERHYEVTPFELIVRSGTDEVRWAWKDLTQVSVATARIRVASRDGHVATWRPNEVSAEDWGRLGDVVRARQQSLVAATGAVEPTEPEQGEVAAAAEPTRPSRPLVVGSAEDRSGTVEFTVAPTEDAYIAGELARTWWQRAWSGLWLGGLLSAAALMSALAAPNPGYQAFGVVAAGAFWLFVAGMSWGPHHAQGARFAFRRSTGLSRPQQWRVGPGAVHLAIGDDRWSWSWSSVQSALPTPRGLRLSVDGRWFDWPRESMPSHDWAALEAVLATKRAEDLPTVELPEGSVDGFDLDASPEELSAFESTLLRQLLGLGDLRWAVVRSLTGLVGVPLGVVLLAWWGLSWEGMVVAALVGLFWVQTGVGPGLGLYVLARHRLFPPSGPAAKRPAGVHTGADHLLVASARFAFDVSWDQVLVERLPGFVAVGCGTQWVGVPERVCGGPAAADLVVERWRGWKEAAKVEALSRPKVEVLPLPRPEKAGGRPADPGPVDDNPFAAPRIEP